MKPALTINEPTVTGALRAELYGNPELAKTHLHEARTVLGTMRSLYGVNERIAQGEGGGFYHQWATLKDGTKVHAISNDGQDTLRIYSPPPPLSEEPVKKPEEESREGVLAACGGDTVAWVWKEGAGYSHPDALYGYCVGISWTGNQATGRSQDTEGDNHIFLWQRGGDVDGTTEIIGDTLTYGNPTCISGDGYTIGTDKGFLWSRVEGWRQVTRILTFGGPDIYGAAAIYCLSPDATKAGGSIGWPIADTYFPRPCIWNLKDGTYEVLDDEDTTWGSDSEAFAYIVAGDFGPETAVPGHYEGHTFAAFQPSSASPQWNEPIEAFEQVPVSHPPDADGTYYLYRITHHNGGAVRGMRYDGSAACGWIGVNDIASASATRAAIWGADHALRVLPQPSGATDTTVANDINQSGDIVLVAQCKYTSDESYHWLTWTDAAGWQEALADTQAMGLCITQSGGISGGSYAAALFTPSQGLAASYTTPGDNTGGELTPFDGELICADITKVTILHNADGSTTFEPPMPGLTIQI